MSDGAYVELSLDQGADFTLQINWTDPSNQPYEVIHPIRMQARASTGQTVLDLASSSGNASSGDGSVPPITYSSQSGVLQVYVPNSQTVGIPSGQYYFDMFVTYRAKVYNMSGSTTDSERRMKLLYGTISVEGRVTQDV